MSNHENYMNHEKWKQYAFGNSMLLFGAFFLLLETMIEIR